MIVQSKCGHECFTLTYIKFRYQNKVKNNLWQTFRGTRFNGMLIW